MTALPAGATAANQIASRLSLRPPQRESLEILARVAELLPLSKDQDLAASLAAIRAEFGHVADFEREFPSLCFALATGVGKTRLMGAFIAYLHRVEGIRHFFVLAPNLTIYNKLIADFTPNTPKYVFQGIAEFSTTPPEIITGDNYESGRGVRSELFEGTAAGGLAGPIHINIFNISKINSEVRGGASPRIKRLSEYIGESYFEYLSKLDDLVLLMDESHRYRASAGVRAINELRPILGLELTATPHIESGAKTIDFKNVIYSYTLASAMRDGFVKEPAVATRENFDARNYDEKALERLKLEDGIRVHENTKVELEVYARTNAQRIVKPFMLVVAQDTTHAGDLQKLIEDPGFLGGRYKGKVITVHSNQRGEEKDETVQQLLSVEDPANPTEIVIHVNMLKEGWDVTNLYTIVPLRAANSKVLVEQSIGRGLRLPYGKRVGVEAVDTLTIVSHDKFQEIIDYARSGESIIKRGVVIGRDIPDEPTRVVQVQPLAITRLVGPAPGSGGAVAPQSSTGAGQQPPLFTTPLAQAAAMKTWDVLRDFERLPSASQLTNPETKQAIVDRVRREITPAQGQLDGVGETVEIERVVEQVIAVRAEMTIDIPKITTQPKGGVKGTYRRFTLDTSSINYPPVENDILTQYLTDQRERRLVSGDGVVREERLENYIVRGLMDFDDISYDDHAELLFELAGQVVAKLRTYLASDDDLHNVLRYHQQAIVRLVHAQMSDHYQETSDGFETVVSKGFTTLRPKAPSLAMAEEPHDFRQPVERLGRIRLMLFTGWTKGLYPAEKFDSDAERRCAVIVEKTQEVQKWYRPSKGDFRIYHSNDEEYIPDFAVETTDGKYIVEVKARSEMDDPTVEAKAAAAAEWCRHATEHAKKHGGKPWRYAIIPDDELEQQKTLRSLLERYGRT
jgi:type III restriction enzyme